jgi:beta-galactosidase
MPVNKHSFFSAKNNHLETVNNRIMHIIKGENRSGLIILLFCILSVKTCFSIDAQTRKTVLLDDAWKFAMTDFTNAHEPEFYTDKWQNVTVPHDWAIYGPFDYNIDKYRKAISENGETKAKYQSGRTGALPFVGVGWYRTTLPIPESISNKKVIVAFDGAMSNAQVFVNGQKVGERPYGYVYFYFDITQYIEAGKENVIAVRLENKEQQSRWYPGAGLYRKVSLIVKDESGFQHWGHYITTPDITKEQATVNIKSKFLGEGLRLVAKIKDNRGNEVAVGTKEQVSGNEVELNISVPNPKLWSPDEPNLYHAELALYKGNELKDRETVRFGIRSIEFNPAKGGFLLNNKVDKFKGVCLHHDLGPLGAAVNKAAIRRKLTILKDMGCNAIRTSHNMPSIEMLELCDEMGFMVMAESFDEWYQGKNINAYNKFFDDWAEKDLVNLIHATRNHPSIVLWSIGNEIPGQQTAKGAQTAKWLQDICHREDPSRKVTIGVNNVSGAMNSGLAQAMDVFGINYHTYQYQEAYDKMPQKLILGAETASTISSRGVYKFPVTIEKGTSYPDGQISSYDLEYCPWSNLPEDDFVLQDDKDWVIGEFVWTGFDYLGEPTPYQNSAEGKARSSFFGIVDLAGLPKDRYYLYRSRWNADIETLHILPHWNWEGKEGDTVPVFVYTNYNRAELFVNGISQGIQTKNNNTMQSRYRLMWMDVKYQPGTLKVVAYDDNGKTVAVKEVKTAGAPHHLKLEADRTTLTANGKDLSYVTVSVVDKDGNLCPTASNQLNFKVSGKGTFRAVCNGDATSLEQFHLPTMKVFNGKLVVTVQSMAQAGEMELLVEANGLLPEKITIQAK